VATQSEAAGNGAAAVDIILLWSDEMRRTFAEKPESLAGNSQYMYSDNNNNNNAVGGGLFRTVDAGRARIIIII